MVNGRDIGIDDARKKELRGMYERGITLEELMHLSGREHCLICRWMGEDCAKGLEEGLKHRNNALHERAKEVVKEIMSNAECSRSDMTGVEWYMHIIECELTHEVYLTKQQFMEQFVIDSEDKVYKYGLQGLPRMEIAGKLMYPKYACHRWFAGYAD